MCYCLRWSPDGERNLFYFGNHTVANVREEPRISCVFTADKNMNDLHLAVDMSYERQGVHWSMHPDGKRLVGYGPSAKASSRCVLTLVNYDGSDYHAISDHHSYGHPSICPTDYNIAVTDEPGRVLFIDTRTGRETGCSYSVPWKNVETPPFGRSKYRVRHHAVFDRSGTKVLFNTLPGKNAQLIEADIPGL